jgi:hypothetical protein
VIIALTGQKGGVGKSTVAISVAAELLKQGYRVLIVDTDPSVSRPNTSVASPRLQPKPRRHSPRMTPQEKVPGALKLTDGTGSGRADSSNGHPSGGAWAASAKQASSVAGASATLAGTAWRSFTLARSLTVGFCTAAAAGPIGRRLGRNQPVAELRRIEPRLDALQADALIFEDRADLELSAEGRNVATKNAEHVIVASFEL